MSDSKRSENDPMAPVDIPGLTSPSNDPNAATSDSQARKIPSASSSTRSKTRTNYSSQRYRQTRGARQIRSLVIFVVVCLAILVGVVAFYRYEKNRQDGSLSRQAAANLHDDRRQVDLSTGETDGRSGRSKGQTNDAVGNRAGRRAHADRDSDAKNEENTQAPTQEKTQALSKENLTQFGQLLKRARVAISNRQFDDAQRLLAQSRTLKGAETHHAMVDRLGDWMHYVKLFWKGFENGINEIEGTEIELQGKRVYVVTCNSEKIVLKMLGRNREASMVNPPTKLAMALADRWFDPSAMSTKVIKGSYLLTRVDKKAESDDSTLQAVKQLWQDARKRGAELGDLEKILTDDYSFSLE